MSGRRKHDKYDTPYAPLIVNPLIDFLGGSLKGKVFEPCAGDGNLAKAIEELTECRVLQADIQASEDRLVIDATDEACWMNVEYYAKFRIDWTITNPPFNLALPIIKNAWEFSDTGIAFLLPITWNEPCGDRRDWLVDHADNLRCIMPVSPRIHFRKGELTPEGKPYGVDPRTVAWYVWRKDWSWSEMGIQSPFQYLAGWR